MTPQTQEAFTQLLLSNTRPIVRGQMNGSYTNWYRQLRQLQQVPIQFTWDQPALARCIDTRIWLLAKIFEIHFKSSNKQPDPRVEIAGQEQKWFYSFDPATGVLTAGFNEYASSVAAWSSLSKWIIKNLK